MAPLQLRRHKVQSLWWLARAELTTFFLKRHSLLYQALPSILLLIFVSLNWHFSKLSFFSINIVLKCIIVTGRMRMKSQDQIQEMTYKSQIISSWTNSTAIYGRASQTRLIGAVNSSCVSHSPVLHQFVSLSTVIRICYWQSKDW